MKKHKKNVLQTYKKKKKSKTTTQRDGDNSYEEKKRAIISVMAVESDAYKRMHAAFRLPIP